MFSKTSGNKRKRLLQGSRFLAALAFVCVMATSPTVVSATYCPFCSAVARTFAEQIDASDIVVIASLIEKPSAPDQTTLPRGKFRTVSILKGSDIYHDGDEFSAVVVGSDHEVGQKFLLMGSGFEDVNWTTPMRASPRVVEYLEQLETLPEKGPERLQFFATYFEDEESVLAYDAYDEFARADYADVKQLRDKLDHDKIIGWIQDPDVMKSRKRLYYTLLGVCGRPQDVDMLEEILKSGDRDRQAGLDALIACYLTLTGDRGVALVESQFLSNANAEYIDVFSAIQALRFHGTEADKVSVKRIVEALRLVLDRPKMADMVIPDLARWNDWEVMDRLVKMFMEANTDETNWVRTPIISYLQACPKPQAKKHIAELREIDPAAVKRAEMLANLNWDDEEDEDEDKDQAESDDVPGETKKTEEKNEGDGDRHLVAKPVTTVEPDTKMSAFVDQGTECNRQQQNAISLAEPAANAGEIPGGPSSDQPETHPGVANSPAGLYVSTRGDRRADSDAATDSGPLAQSANEATPLAATSHSSNSIAVVLLVPIIACALLFALLWSVLNGWFERLIF